MLLRRRSAKIDLLENVPLFSALSRRHLDLIARHADEVRRGAGEVLTRQGGLGLEFLLIVDGSARVERDGKSIARLGPGDFFGEMSLIDGKPRSATVITEAPTVLLVIHTRSFGHLLNAIPALQKKILVTLCERLRTADVALASLN
jgi:CRP/FNR family cyclic AMP-dependent transcriptional regulator